MKVMVKKGLLEPVNKKEKKVLQENVEMEIEIVSPKKFSWRGALADMKISSVELQHQIKNRW